MNTTKIKQAARAIVFTLMVIILLGLLGACTTTKNTHAAFPCPKMQQKQYKQKVNYVPAHSTKLECLKHPVKF